MKRQLVLGLTLVIAVTACLGTFSVGDEKDEAIDFKKVYCPVSGGKVKEASSLEHDDCTVYFCCNNCPKAFKKNPDKYEAKTNHQLVATRQAKQIKCPKTGGKVKASTGS